MALTITEWLFYMVCKHVMGLRAGSANCELSTSTKSCQQACVSLCLHAVYSNCLDLQFGNTVWNYNVELRSAVVVWSYVRVWSVRRHMTASCVQQPRSPVSQQLLQ